MTEPSEVVLQYYWTGNALWALWIAWAIGIPAAMVATGAGRRARDFVDRSVGHWLPTILGTYSILAAVAGLTAAPLVVLSGWVRPHAFGLSHQPFGDWVLDTGIGGLLALGLGAALVWVPYGCMRLSRRRWWIPCSLAASVAVGALFLLSPVLVDPLFTNLRPLEDGALRSRIEDVGRRAGFEIERVVVAETSDSTRAVNAAVTGLGPTRRMVLWDTLLKELDDDAVVFVAGHELAHLALRHLERTVVVLSIWIGIGLWVTHAVGHRLVSRARSRLAVDDLADPASLPLLTLVLVTWLVATLPVPLAVSRHQERAADAFASHLVSDPVACEQTFRRLQSVNLSHPSPGRVATLLRSSHPAPADRIARCRAEDPSRVE